MVAQAGIVIFGALAVWLSQDSRPEVRRWACISGLAAQPFWFWTTWHAGQWGIFAISFVYTFGWLRGLRHYWMERA